MPGMDALTCQGSPQGREGVAAAVVAEPAEGSPVANIVNIDGRSKRFASPEIRFWEKINKNGPVSPSDGSRCWLWTGATSDSGYGAFRAHGRMVYVHRFSYGIAFGSLRGDQHVDHRHTCPKTCVRPDHLREASPKQNSENRKGAQAGSLSGVRGVTWDKRSREWVARVGHQGRRITVGRFRDLGEAEKAVVARRNELFTHNDADREASA